MSEVCFVEGVIPLFQQEHEVTVDFEEMFQKKLDEIRDQANEDINQAIDDIGSIINAFESKYWKIISGGVESSVSVRNLQIQGEWSSGLIMKNGCVYNDFNGELIAALDAGFFMELKDFSLKALVQGRVNGDLGFLHDSLKAANIPLAFSFLGIDAEVRLLAYLDFPVNFRVDTELTLLNNTLMTFSHGHLDTRPDVYASLDGEAQLLGFFKAALAVMSAYMTMDALMRFDLDNAALFQSLSATSIHDFASILDVGGWFTSSEIDFEGYFKATANGKTDIIVSDVSDAYAVPDSAYNYGNTTAFARAYGSSRLKYKVEKEDCIKVAGRKVSCDTDTLEKEDKITGPVTIGEEYTLQEVEETLQNSDPAVINDDLRLGDFEIGLLLYLLSDDKELATELMQCGFLKSRGLRPDTKTKPLFALLNEGDCVMVGSAFRRSEYFSDAACQTQVDYYPLSFFDYCRNNMLNDDHGKNYLGNPDAWDDFKQEPHNDFPVYRHGQWVPAHGASLEILLTSLENKTLPFMKQVQYRQAGDCALEMRIYKNDPAADNLKPFLWIHGGAWTFRGFVWESIVPHLTNKGYMVFAPLYRLLGDSDAPPECRNAKGQDILDDVNAALDWVQANKESYGADPLAKISVGGRSAGGHLSGYLALHRSEEIAQGLFLYPVTDFRYMINQVYDSPVDANGDPAAGSFADRYAKGTGLLSLFISEPEGQGGIKEIEAGAEGSERVDLNAPLIVDNSYPTLVESGYAPPPLFMIHGDADKTVPSSNSVRLCRALRGGDEIDLPINIFSSDCGNHSSGRNHRLHVVPGGDHVLDIDCNAILDILFYIGELSEDEKNLIYPGRCPSGSAIGEQQTKQALDEALEWLNQ